MTHTDTRKAGLETLIVESLVNEAGYAPGRSEDCDRDQACSRTTAPGPESLCAATAQ
jgi:hypothetical protein